MNRDTEIVIIYVNPNYTYYTIVQIKLSQFRSFYNIHLLKQTVIITQINFHGMNLHKQCHYKMNLTMYI